MVRVTIGETPRPTGWIPVRVHLQGGRSEIRRLLTDALSASNHCLVPNEGGRGGSTMELDRRYS